MDTELRDDRAKKSMIDGNKLDWLIILIRQIMNSWTDVDIMT